MLGVLARCASQRSVRRSPKTAGHRVQPIAGLRAPSLIGWRSTVTSPGLFRRGLTTHWNRVRASLSGIRSNRRIGFDANRRLLQVQCVSQDVMVAGETLQHNFGVPAR
jgi:hypothetical protein